MELRAAFKSSDKFSFGKYKGLSLKEVFQGTQKISHTLIKEFILDAIKSRPPLFSGFLIDESFFNGFEIGETLIRFPNPDKKRKNDWSKELEEYFRNGHGYLGYELSTNISDYADNKMDVSRELYTRWQNEYDSISQTIKDNKKEYEIKLKHIIRLISGIPSKLKGYGNLTVANQIKTILGEIGIDLDPKFIEYSFGDRFTSDKDLQAEYANDRTTNADRQPITLDDLVVIADIISKDKNIFKLTSDVKGMLPEGLRKLPKIASGNSWFTDDFVKGIPEVVEGHPDYIEWCIKTIDKFAIFPEELMNLSTLDVYYFVGIKLVQNMDDIYSYAAEYACTKHTITDYIRKLNEEKFSRYSII